MLQLLVGEFESRILGLFPFGPSSTSHPVITYRASFIIAVAIATITAWDTSRDMFRGR
jgi:hypothetical protein